MEKRLEKQLEDTMSSEGVVGVLCANKEGLCLAAKGNAQQKSSGLISSIVQIAKHLHSDAEEPVICLESENMNILIKGDEEITMAIYKEPP